MRAIIAQRMAECADQPARPHRLQGGHDPHRADAREREGKYEQRNGVKLTYMPFIRHAAIEALRKHPIVNASLEGSSIRYNKNINIGIAVALEWGLIVPVVKQAEERSFLGIARAIVDLAERARGKRLSPTRSRAARSR